LQNHQFKSSALSRARDVFCFMCWTGQRYSDITNLTRKQLCLNDHKETIWKLVTVKTNENISVPIISYAEEIMAKYEKEEYPIPRFTNQKLNFHLKTIGEKAEINNLVKEGQSKMEAIMNGASDRFRPVLMTACTTIFALLPTAINQSHGSEANVPLAMVVIGGTFMATVLTLYIIPVLYMLIAKKGA